MSSFFIARSQRPRVSFGALGVVFLALVALTAEGQVAKPQAHKAPVMRPANQAPARDPQPKPQATETGGGARTQLQQPRPEAQQRPDAQEHLGQWINSHNNLTLEQKQSALDAEPGFRNLKPQEQQRIHQLVTRLNSMPPDQRQKLVQRTEAMERLVPAQRQMMRNATGQLGSLPQDRQRAVVRAFRSAIELPEGQRQSYLNSPQVRGQFNENERETLSNLVAIQPAAAQAGFPEFSSRQPANQPH